jgi:hypothetical protein
MKTSVMKILKYKFSLQVVVFATAFLIAAHTAIAQTPHREEITIIAPYEPTLPDVFKINLQPRIETEESSIPAPQISITPRKINVKHTTEAVQEAPPPVEQPDIIYRNHIRAGFGNYITPYIEFNAGSLRNANYLMNLQFRHLASYGKIIDYGHSSFSDNMARVSAMRFFDRLTLGAEARYDHNILHHYGFLKADFPDTLFATSKDDLRQRFNQSGISMTAKSNIRQTEGFHYDARLAYGFINDLFQTSEHRFEFETDLRASFRVLRSNDKQILGVKLDVGSYNLTDSLTTWNNTLIQVQPYFKFRYQEYELTTGVGMAFDNDTSMNFRIFPAVEGRLQLVENRFAVFVGADGKVQKNSFYSLAQENPFIQSVLEYKNTAHKLRFYGGLQGSVGKRLDFTAGFSNTILGNAALFVNDTSFAPFNRFAVVYDDMNLLQGNVFASYSVSEQLRITTGFDIYHYTPDREEKAWHKPAFRAFLEGWYNFSEKLAFRAAVNANGKFWAKVFDADTGLYEPKQLDQWADISFGGTYRYSDQLHFFVDARNITAGRHYYWYNYPSQRLHIMAGAGFSF